MGRSYRDMVKNALDELEKDIGEVKNELNSAFTKIVKLAFLLGEYYVGVHAYMDGAYATDIASTHTGNGYWVSFSDGSIYGFGDATPS